MFNHEHPLSLYAYIVWSSKQQHFFEMVLFFSLCMNFLSLLITFVWPFCTKLLMSKKGSVHACMIFFAEYNENSVIGFLCLIIIIQGWSGERPVRCWIPVHLWQFRVHPSGWHSAQQRPVWVGSTVCWTVSCWYVIDLHINPSMNPYIVLIYTWSDYGYVLYDMRFTL